MTAYETLILGTYFFVLVILAVYGWHRYYLVYLYMKHKGKQPVPAGPMEKLPLVTIQLPIYNEMYVADRLIDSVCRLDYPRELLEIQVLDDSTDETQGVAEQAVRRRKSTVGMKSASKMAMKRPLATCRPASSAPALYPMRSARCR